MEISQIDKNFAVNTTAHGGEFLNIDCPPIKIYGLERDSDGYFRVPGDVATATSNDVFMLSRQTAGGIFRFKTNSEKLTIKAENPVYSGLMPHMTHVGACGFAAFEGEKYLGSFMPAIPIGNMCVEQTLAYAPNSGDDDGFHEITVYMPLYGAYTDISIKIDENAEIRPASAFRNRNPVVFYGSSITQGACSSVPSAAFTNVISRKLDIYCKNLGFSGSAKGEQAIVDYMASLEMSAFVLDYDHNAPTPEHLEKTHENVYLAVRQAHPDIPIVIASSIPYVHWTGEYITKRRNIIKKTYDNAVASGDKNVYFIDGCGMFKDIPFDDATVDGCHPTDLGMYLMAKSFGEVLQKCLPFAKK